MIFKSMVGLPLFILMIFFINLSLIVSKKLSKKDSRVHHDDVSRIEIMNSLKDIGTVRTRRYIGKDQSYYRSETKKSKHRYKLHQSSLSFANEMVIKIKTEREMKKKNINVNKKTSTSNKQQNIHDHVEQISHMMSQSRELQNTQVWLKWPEGYFVQQETPYRDDHMPVCDKSKAFHTETIAFGCFGVIQNYDDSLSQPWIQPWEFGSFRTKIYVDWYTDSAGNHQVPFIDYYAYYNHDCTGNVYHYRKQLFYKSGYSLPVSMDDGSPPVGGCEFNPSIQDVILDGCLYTDPSLRPSNCIGNHIVNAHLNEALNMLGCINSTTPCTGQYNHLVTPAGFYNFATADDRVTMLHNAWFLTTRNDTLPVWANTTYGSKVSLYLGEYCEGQAYVTETRHSTCDADAGWTQNVRNRGDESKCINGTIFVRACDNRLNGQWFDTTTPCMCQFDPTSGDSNSNYADNFYEAGAAERAKDAFDNGDDFTSGNSSYGSHGNNSSDYFNASYVMHYRFGYGNALPNSWDHSRRHFADDYTSLSGGGSHFNKDDSWQNSYYSYAQEYGNHYSVSGAPRGPFGIGGWNAKSGLRSFSVGGIDDYGGNANGTYGNYQDPPTPTPTSVLTAVPSSAPTAVPTSQPTAVPTHTGNTGGNTGGPPTPSPTIHPSTVPTPVPTPVPPTHTGDAGSPTPTSAPTAVPTSQPTAQPTSEPTTVPTSEPTAVPTSVPTAVPISTTSTTGGVDPSVQPALTVEDVCGFTPQSHMLNNALYNQTACDHMLHMMTIVGGNANDICNANSSNIIKKYLGLYTMMGCCGYFTSVNNTVTVWSNADPTSPAMPTDYIVGSNKCFDAPANPCESHEFLGDTTPSNWVKMSDGTDAFPQTCHSYLYYNYLPLTWLGLESGFGSLDYDDLSYTYVEYANSLLHGTTDISFCSASSYQGSYRMIESYLFGLGCCPNQVQKPTCGQLDVCANDDFKSLSSEYSREYIESADYSLGPTYSQILHGSVQEIQQYYTSVSNFNMVNLRTDFSQYFMSTIQYFINSNPNTMNLNLNFQYEEAKHVFDEESSYLEIIYTFVNASSTHAKNITNVIQNFASGSSLISRMNSIIQTAIGPSAPPFSMNVIASQAKSVDESIVSCGEAYGIFDYVSNLYGDPSCDDQYGYGMKWGELVATLARKCCMSQTSTCQSYDTANQAVSYDASTCNQRYNYHNVLSNTCGDCRLEPFSIRLHRRHKLEFEDCVGPRGDFTID